MGGPGEDSVSQRPSTCQADCVAAGGACSAAACTAAGGCTAVGGCQYKAPPTETTSVQEPQSDVVQIAFVGCENVGKTALIHKLVKGEQLEEYKPTGYDVCTHHIKVDGKDVNFKIGDAGGAASNSEAMNKNIMESSGFILVYDITKKETFEELQKIRNKLITMKKPPTDLPIVIVANKSDLNPQRVVLSKQGQALGKSLKCPFFETSITTGENINEAVQALLSDILKKAANPPAAAAGKEAKKGCCTVL